MATTSLKNLTTASCLINRSRFFVKTVDTYTTSSIAKPMNQRNRRLYCTCSALRSPSRESSAADATLKDVVELAKRK
jgi:hypothetical protein